MHSDYDYMAKLNLPFRRGKMSEGTLGVRGSCAVVGEWGETMAPRRGVVTIIYT